MGITITETRVQEQSSSALNTKDIINIVYPVGSIYMSVNSTSPALLFGGTWEQLKDRFLLASGDTYSAGSMGGEAQHTLTINEMPRHSHDYYFDMDSSKNWSIGLLEGIVGPDVSAIASGPQGRSYTLNIRETGGSQPHNNMPPYLTVYMWKRIA